METHLYVNTHSSGLKYLGKTTQDPYRYAGSGTRWKHHLTKHGNNVTTEIIRTCHSQEELVKWGTYYSNIFNVVESDRWANLRAETGDGGDTSKTPGYIESHRRRKEEGGYATSWNKGLRCPRSKDSIEKQRKTITGKKRGSYNYNHLSKSTSVVIDGVQYCSISEARRVLNCSYYSAIKRAQRD